MTRQLSSLFAAGTLASVVLLAGCKAGQGTTVLRPGGSGATASGSTSGANSPANGSTDAPTNGPSAGGNVAGGPRQPAKPAEILSIDSLPAELKNDAFEYYGLGRKLPITMTLTSNNTPQVGAQDVRLLEVTPEEAKFEIISTDGLNLFGRNVVGLRKDGIRILESEIMQSEPGDFELPAGLSTGRTWSTRQKLEDGSRSMKVTLAQKVVGPQALTTKVAAYPDALYVTGQGEGTFNGKPVKMKTQSWFVRGRGTVKQVIDFTQNGRTDTTTIEESK